MSRKRRQRPTPGQTSYGPKYVATATRTLPQLPVRPYGSKIRYGYNFPYPKTKLGDISHERTRSIRRSQHRTNTLYSPYSQTVLARRRNSALRTLGRTIRRSPLLGRKVRTPGRLNPCTKRAARRAVLFNNRLIGKSGSTPGS